MAPAATVPRCFPAVTMDGYLTRETIREVRRVIEDEEYRVEMVNRNYDLCKVFFSYSVLRRKLRAVVTNFTGADEL